MPSGDIDERVRGITSEIRARLVAWYQGAHRDLPWRDVRDPYAIWVSEVMLQQTQVRTVIPYFERFMRRFPTIEALASAPLEDVLSAWKGLGYYSRARNLHRGAGEAVRLYDGSLPPDPAKLRRIPGIGRYTAGAVASIAFDQCVPVLDGNVIRVLCRLFAVQDDPSASSVKTMLWRWAGLLVPEQDPGTFNQAIMELGALVCVRQRPDCGHCPLEALCEARLLPDPGALPVRTPKRTRPDIHAVCLVIRDPATGSLLFGRRPANGLLGGLWELPTGQSKPGETPVATARRVSRARFGFDLNPTVRPETVVHIFTHLRLLLNAAVCRDTPFPCPMPEGDSRPEPASVPSKEKDSGVFDVPYLEYRWVRQEALDTLPVGRATGKVLEHLAQESLLCSTPGKPAI